MYIKNGIIDHIDEKNNQAAILIEENQILLWEANNLPPNIAAGSEVVIEIKHKEEALQLQEDLARNILQEIFNTTER